MLHQPHTPKLPLLFVVKDLVGVLSFAYIANKDTALHGYDTRKFYLLEVTGNVMFSRLF